jgi:uncharacterized protein (DUF2147 family)
MKKTILLFTFSILFTGLFAQAPNPDDIVGSWLTASGKAIVKIYKEGNVYNGRITWLKTPLNEAGKPKVDKNNPDVKQRNAPLIGLNLLKGFVFKHGQWEDGTIYDPENGKTYSCRIRYRDGMLDLRGYVGITLMGRTQVWYRAESKNK